MWCKVKKKAWDNIYGTIFKSNIKHSWPSSNCSHARPIGRTSFREVLRHPLHESSRQHRWTSQPSCTIHQHWRECWCKKKNNENIRSSHFGTYPYPKRKRIGRFEDYTTLNTSRDVILHEACNHGSVQHLPSAISHPSTDSAKKCNYHKNMGHTTEECFKVRASPFSDQGSINH